MCNILGDHNDCAVDIKRVLTQMTLFDEINLVPAFQSTQNRSFDSVALLGNSGDLGDFKIKQACNEGIRRAFRGKVTFGAGLQMIACLGLLSYQFQRHRPVPLMA
jgi:hypothetical protein